MMRFFKSTAVLAALLFSAQGAQAGIMPTNISEDFGVFTSVGTADSAIYALPIADPDYPGDPFDPNNPGDPEDRGDPAVNWYKFTLGSNLVGSATVTLDTEILYATYPYNEIDFTGPSTDYIDTILALYDSSGALVLNSDGENQNDDCPTGTWFSCGTFNLVAGTYIAGVNDAQFMTSFEPFLPGLELTGRDYSDESYTALSISVDGVFGPVSVPEPATFWLLGIGMLGLIGVARRRQFAF